ncbi:cytochrome P450 4d2 [Aethina tumida]|uniref:cytochrome P450 4d2 n=1 Tax=Aethina tumida TaxID=116153 RepID=UPI00096AE831|nr:cytochrome P450 4d2 [Aethina tumida]
MLEIVIATILLLFATPFIWWYLLLEKFKSLNDVPGPKPIPILGNANVVGNTTVSLLNSFMDLQKQYGGLYKLWLGTKLNLMVTKPEYVEYFTSSNTHLSKSDGYDLFKPWLGDSLLVTTGQKWRSRRKMITPTFHFQVLEKFMDVFNAQSNTLLSNLEKEVETNNNKRIEMHYFVNMCTLDIICETAFGTSIRAQHKGNPKYVEAVSSFLEIFTLRFFSPWMANDWLFRFSELYPRYKKHLKILHDFTNNVIKDRRAARKERKDNPISEDGIKIKAALLDMLLDASENGYDLTDEDIRAEVDTFMFEGHDTASTAVCFTLLALAQNPAIQHKVYEELVEVLGPESTDDVTCSQMNDLKYLDIVIKESMRLYSPVPLIARRLDTDCVLDGITIPKDTTINIFLYGMNHSTEVFPEPEKFDPERFLPEKQSSRHNFAYVPFAAGPRNCIGQKFAVLELKTIISKICRKFEIVPVENYKPEIGMCSVLKSRNGIVMGLKVRQ